MRFWGVFLLMVGILGSQLALANVVITGTRIVYPAQNKEIGIELTNASTTPALLQAWITQADENNTKPTPFILTPPIFRMDGNKKQTLRVMYTHESLPKDRETLFYFNLLDIPPKPDVEQLGTRNYLQFSILSKLKLFYRPKNLKPSIDKAYGYLKVNINGQGLIVSNPTPYHMTISKVALLTQPNDTRPLAETEKTPMIEPYGKATIALFAPSAKVAKITLINDYGGSVAVPINIQ